MMAATTSVVRYLTGWRVLVPRTRQHSILPAYNVTSLPATRLANNLAIFTVRSHVHLLPPYRAIFHATNSAAAYRSSQRIQRDTGWTINNPFSY